MSKVEPTVKPTIPEHVQHYAANRHGFLTVGDVQLDCDVLLDSGASHANYMSESYYVRNLHRLAEYTVRTKSSVYMGDKVTKATIDKLVRLPLLFLLLLSWMDLWKGRFQKRDVPFAKARRSLPEKHHTGAPSWGENKKAPARNTPHGSPK